ncbi:GDSL-type esterase/lipase family protein [Arcticibacter tournemirensis]
MQRRQVLKGILTSAAGMVALKAGASTIDEISTGFVSQPETNEPVVINSGVGGNNTVDLLNRIEKDCYAHKPKLTVLMIGTNDMNSRKHVPLEQYEKNLSLIITGIKDKGSKVLLMTILPFYEPYLMTRHPVAFYEPEGPVKRRAQVIEAIKQAAKQHKTHLLDLGMRFEAVGKIGTDKDSLIKNEVNSNKTDGLHPTANGYRFIGLSVYDYILYNDLPKTNIVCFGDSITHGDGPVESYPGYLKRLLSSSK